MKNLIYTYLILTLIGCGTDQDEGKFYNYSIKNESGKNIKINSYRNSYPIRDTPTVIELENGEELIKNYQTLPSPPVDLYNFNRFFEGDSLVINYSNEKKANIYINNRKHKKSILLLWYRCNIHFYTTRL